MAGDAATPPPPPPPQKLAARRSKSCYVGAPAIFALELAAKEVVAAFGGYESGGGLYLVGSALERADWRDVDLRYILPDDEFHRLFPGAGQNWEFDPRWLLMSVAISERLSRLSGLPIDFQFQPQSHANARHNGPRHAVGLRFARPQVIVGDDR